MAQKIDKQKYWSKKPSLIFILLSAFCCAPVWGVKYFISQDGSGHVHGAWAIIELLRGSHRFTETFQFNFIFFPDVSGHWLMATLLLILSPFTVTKIILTLTLIGMIAAAGWLRWRTAGSDGINTSFLIGAALGFNWLWLTGFYNFEISFITAIFTVGLFYGWRYDMNVWRSIVFATLLVLIFVSHIVGFAIVSAAICILCLLPLNDLRRKNLLWTAAAFIPNVPLIAIYKLQTEAGSGFSPIWKSLKDPYSLSNWITQFRGVDSFIIISRKAFPFIHGESSLFAIFTPLLWIMLALALLIAASWFTRLREQSTLSNKLLPFAVLAAGSIFVAMFSPDDLQFTSSTGGGLRERFFLAGLFFLVPLYSCRSVSTPIKWLANLALLFVIVFQTAATWEYALRSDSESREYLTAASSIPEATRLAAITIEPNGSRFSANSVSSLDNFIGIGRDVFIWDNYEFGHYLFPVIAKRKADQEFVLEYTSHNAFKLDDPQNHSEERINKLAEILESDHQRIGTLLVWGTDPQIESAYQPWFEPEPYFVNGRVRLYRHK